MRLREKVERMHEILDRQLTDHAEIQLQRRGPGIYEIVYNGIFLMASYNDYSERILARATIERLLPPTDGYQILVGGLGMGFTLQEVLACPRVSKAFVIEIEKAIIHWNRFYFSEFNGRAIEDPRTILLRFDLFDFLFQARQNFHAILIDVDNGPNWLALEKNQRLYTESTLQRLKTLLTPGGVLATWSARPDECYYKRLNRVFLKTAETRLREIVPKGGESVIYFGMAGN
jgi:spermidine synthase